jgi:tetratricopeptide (TPR) repeat protein
MKPHCLLLGALLGLFLGHAAKAEGPNWETQIRECVAAHQFREALQIVEDRLAKAPQDLEAAGWRARLLAWSGRWKEAEEGYRRVLAAAPQDIDMLVGLANLLTWQRRYEESLSLLENAAQIDPHRADIYISKGQAYRGLARTEQARRAFQQALALEPSNADARAGLASLDGEARYELRFSSDIDTFNFTDAGQAYTTSLGIRINSRWSTSISGVSEQRFGQQAGRFLGSVSYRLTRRDSLTLGGGVAHDQAVVPKSESFFEYGRGFSFGDRGPARGAEASYHQHWFWYQNARVLALTPGILFYFPRGWTWSLEGTAARSHLSGLGAEWQPSGSTRLGFPLYRRLSGNVSFGVGTEDFALVDQVGRFSARTFGGGLHYSLSPRQELTNYFFTQDRSQGRTQTSFGFSYAIRF